jgi:hypothetical protein
MNRNNQTRKNKKTLASRFFRRGNNSNSNSNNNSNNANNANEPLNRLEMLRPNGYVNNGSRTLRFRGVRRVRNIPQEGKSIPASAFVPASKTKTRRHIGALASHPAPLTNRFTSSAASQLLADAHAKSNSFSQMATYIQKANLSKYLPLDLPQHFKEKLAPKIKEKATTKLIRSYRNLVANAPPPPPPPPPPVGAVAPKLPNGNNWTEWFNR